MRTITDSAEDSDLFRLVAFGHIPSALVWAGIELGLFTLLSEEGPRARSELAQRLGLEDQPLRVLLNGLHALGVLVREDGKYRNGPAASLRLDKNSPGNWLAVLGWQHHIVYRGLFHLAEAVRAGSNVGLREFPGTGDTLYERIGGNPVLEDVFQTAMSHLSGSVNDVLVERVDWSRYKSVVDLGGGDGTNALLIAQAHPWLQVTVFDRPSVCGLARQRIAQAGLADRVGAVEGDLFEDSLPPADCYVLAHMLNIYSQEKNAALLGKCHRALAPGGAVAVLNTMANEDETGPLYPALASAYFLAIASGEGMVYSSNDYHRWFRDAGFDDVECVPLAFDHGLFVATKG